MLDPSTLATVILAPLVAGTLLCTWAGTRGRPALRANRAALAAALVTGFALALVLGAAERVFAGAPLAARWDWVPEIGLNLSLRLDGLALMFCLLILGIGLLVILYARYYLDASDDFGKFYGTLMLFMAAMLGIVLADNLLVLVVFWELTSISSFLLVGYWNTEREARRGARMALTVTGAGGLAMLGGFVLLGHIAGTYEISALAAERDRIQAHALFPAALVLILLGAFTKSAQFPFHFWLPDAMAAPTPVSAYLHSATMVKAGLYLVARLYPVFGGSALFEWIVVPVGLATLAFGAYVAIFKHDLKGLLAYSTISHLGLVMFLIGLDTPLSAVAAMFHIVNHAAFKASLFMAAGIVDHECGTRDMRRINGLARYMPYTAALAIVASLAMAGVPLFNGFLSKEMFFAEALQARHLGAFGAAIPFIVVLAGAFSMAYSVRFIHDVFFNGAPRDLPRTPHEPPRYIRMPVEVLVVVCVVVGLAPAITVQPLVALAARDVVGAELPEFTFALWHGFNWPLVMSALGLAIYFALARGYGLHRFDDWRVTGRSLFDATIAGLVALARRVTEALANGSLQRYLVLTLVVAVAAAALPLVRDGLTLGERPGTPATALAVVVWAIVVVASLASVLLHRRRLVLVLLVACVGLGVALTFVYFSAPDLAMTQLSVEVVSTVLLLMGLALLPAATPPESSTARRWRDGAIAVAAGTGAAAIAWAVLTRPFETLSWYFLEQTVPKGGGANAVNVILVDFRGFDTLGEITVLGIAAIGVLALLDSLRVERPRADSEGRAWSRDLYPIMLRVASRWMLPLALLVSVYVFLRGHNAPGGGFIAGLITAVALVTQYMAYGLARTDARIGLDYSRVIGWGLLVACGTGAASWFAGASFLTSAHGYPELPLLGAIPLASAAVFDLGVYLAVVGSTLLTLVTLGYASGRTRKEDR
jgi:multicomponent K+:H+ antiporter subunit A